MNERSTDRWCDGCGKRRHDDEAGWYTRDGERIAWFCFFCRKEMR